MATPKRSGRECFIRVGAKREDAPIHDLILHGGDDDRAAEASSLLVLIEDGMSEEDARALLKLPPKGFDKKDYEESKHPRDHRGRFADKPDASHLEAKTEHSDLPHPKPDIEVPPKPVIPRGGVKEITPINTPFKGVEDKPKPALAHTPNAPAPKTTITPIPVAPIKGKVEAGSLDEFGQSVTDSPHWTRPPRNVGYSIDPKAGSGKEYTHYPDAMPLHHRSEMERRIFNASLPSEGLTDHERAAIGVYTTSSYRPINAHLRGTAQSTLGSGIKSMSVAAINKNVAGMDSAFAKASLSEGMITYRGINGEQWGKLKAAGMKPGKVFTDLGYVSTSTRIHFADGWKNGGMLAAVRIPKGSHALPISSISNAPGEYEVLLARGAKFRVLRYDMASQRIILELMRTGSKSSRTIKAMGPDDEDDRADKFIWQDGEIIIEDEESVPPPELPPEGEE